MHEKPFSQLHKGRWISFSISNANENGVPKNALCLQLPLSKATTLAKKSSRLLFQFPDMSQRILDEDTRQFTPMQAVLVSQESQMSQLSQGSVPSIVLPWARNSRSRRAVIVDDSVEDDHLSIDGAQFSPIRDSTSRASENNSRQPSSHRQAQPLAQQGEPDFSDLQEILEAAQREMDGDAAAEEGPEAPEEKRPKKKKSRPKNNNDSSSSSSSSSSLAAEPAEESHDGLPQDEKERPTVAELDHYTLFPCSMVGANPAAPDRRRHDANGDLVLELDHESVDALQHLPHEDDLADPTQERKYWWTEYMYPFFEKPDSQKPASKALQLAMRYWGYFRFQVGYYRAVTTSASDQFLVEEESDYNDAKDRKTPSQLMMDQFKQLVEQDPTGTAAGQYQRFLTLGSIPQFRDLSMAQFAKICPDFEALLSAMIDLEILFEASGVPFFLLWHQGAFHLFLEYEPCLVLVGRHNDYVSKFQARMETVLRELGVPDLIQANYFRLKVDEYSFIPNLWLPDANGHWPVLVSDPKCAHKTTCYRFASMPTQPHLKNVLLDVDGHEMLRDRYNKLMDKADRHSQVPMTRSSIHPAAATCLIRFFVSLKHYADGLNLDLVRLGEGVPSSLAAQNEAIACHESAFRILKNIYQKHGLLNGVGLDLHYSDCYFNTMPYPWVFLRVKQHRCFIEPGTHHEWGTMWFQVNILDGSVRQYCRSQGCKPAQGLGHASTACRLLTGVPERALMNDYRVTYPPDQWQFNDDHIWAVTRSYDDDIEKMVPRLVQMMNRYFSVITSAPDVLYGELMMVPPKGERQYVLRGRTGFLQRMERHQVKLLTRSVRGDYVRLPYSLGELFIKSKLALCFSERVFNPIPYDQPGCARPDQFNDFAGIAITQEKANQWITDYMKQGTDQWVINRMTTSPEQKGPDDLTHCCRYPRLLVPLIGHIARVLCNDDPDCFRYVMGFFASIVQAPWKKLGVCLLFKGEHGCGKGVVIEKLGQIIGPLHYKHIMKMKDLTGEFNSASYDTLLAYVDELNLASYGHGANGHQNDAVESLKLLITEDTQTLRFKHKDAASGKPPPPNHANYLCSSNEPQAVHLPPTERRFAIVTCRPQSGGVEDPQSKAYFDIIRRIPPEALAYLLYQPYWTEGFNARQVPLTKGSQDEKMQNLNSVQNWWFEVITNTYIQNPDDRAELVSLCVLHKAWEAEQRQRNEQPGSNHQAAAEPYPNYETAEEWDDILSYSKKEQLTAKYDKTEIYRVYAAWCKKSRTFLPPNFWTLMKQMVDFTETRDPYQQNVIKVQFPGLLTCRIQWCNFMRQPCEINGIAYQPILERALPYAVDPLQKLKRDRSDNQEEGDEEADDDDQHSQYSLEQRRAAKKLKPSSRVIDLIVLDE